MMICNGLAYLGLIRFCGNPNEGPPMEPPWIGFGSAICFTPVIAQGAILPTQCRPRKKARRRRGRMV